MDKNAELLPAKRTPHSMSSAAVVNAGIREGATGARRVALGKYAVFHAASRDSLAESVKTCLGADVRSLPKSETGLHAVGNRASLPASDLWFCSYGHTVTLKFPESDFVRIQIPRQGKSVTTIRGEQLPVFDSHTCISQGAAELDFGENFQQLVWRPSWTLLTRKIVALTGAPALPTIDFLRIYDLSTPAAQIFSALLANSVRCLETMPVRQAGMVMAELEQAMAVAFLYSSQHNYRALLDGEVQGAAPWQVRRAEAYLEANWDEPFSVEALAESTGASARSIFRTFKQHRGYSPLIFVKRIRLREAFRKLERSEPRSTVTDIALSCGWGDISQFTRDFVHAYGEPPSAVLRRGRARAGTSF